MAEKFQNSSDNESIDESSGLTSPSSLGKEQEDLSLLSMQAEFRGPLPPPELLRQYEDVHPGTAERIMVQFERETQHRHAIEQQLLTAQLEMQRAEIPAFFSRADIWVDYRIDGDSFRCNLRRVGSHGRACLGGCGDFGRKFGHLGWYFCLWAKDSFRTRRIGSRIDWPGSFHVSQVRF
jgi:hypothetical protein